MSAKKASQLLKIVSVVSFALALVFASAAFAPAGPAGLMLDLLDWPLGDGVALDAEAARWLAAIGGGLWASLSALYYFVIAPAVARGDNEARRGGVIAMLVWFVVDSAGSIAAGVPSNALFNAPFLVLFLFPLLAVRANASPALQRA